MQFGKPIKQNYFLSQPHQPFFTLGILNALLMMVLFILSFKGVIKVHMPLTSFHAYSFIYLVFANAFTGFLFTTFPRFNRTKEIDKPYYTKIFYGNIAGTVLFVTGLFFSKALIFVAIAVLCIAYLFIFLKLLEIYKNAAVQNKNDSFWILTAIATGFVSQLLFMFSLYFSALTNTAVISGFYLYLIFLAFSVAQRMIPFFSHSIVQKNDNFPKFIFILLLLKTVFILTSSLDFQIIIDILLSIYLAKEFLRWKLSPFDSQPILWILHLALFWLPLGFILSALTLILQWTSGLDFYFLGIHLLALGFLTTVLIGFGTRVILGHSGQVPRTDKFTIYLFYFTQIVVLSRALLSVSTALGWKMGYLFDMSATFWVILFAAWSYRYGKILILGKS